MKKAIVIVCLLGVGAGAWLLVRHRAASGEPEQAATSQPTWNVTKGDLRVVVESTGRVVPNAEVEIKCKASGEVTRLPVDVSDPVKKGALLVQLDPEDEQRTVGRAKVNLAISQAKLAQSELGLDIAHRTLVTERRRSQATLTSTQAKVQETQSKLGRIQRLVEKQMATPEEHDTARSAHAQAIGDLENARVRTEELKTQEVAIATKEQDLRIAEAQVESDKLSLSEAEQRLKETTVLAPIDGVVTERNVQVGTIIASGINNVGGGTAVMKLADLSRVYVLVSVDESDIGRIAVGQRAQITVDAHPDVSLPGEVVRVATKGAVESNVVTFEVKVEVKGRRRRLLKPEMTANVEIVAVEKSDVVLAPVSVVQRQRRQRFVDLQTSDGSTQRREVQTGATDGERIEITAGLAPGDRVVQPAGGAQSRWRRGETDGRSKRRGDRMKMRMMGGARR